MGKKSVKTLKTYCNQDIKDRNVIGKKTVVKLKKIDISEKGVELNIVE